MTRALALFFVLVFAPFHVAYAAKVQEIKTKLGFTVWLVEEHSLPIVTVDIGFTGSGLAYDPDGKEGRTNMVSALLLEGAGERGAKAFNEALENDAIRLNAGANDDALHATMETLTEHKDIAFSLLADSLIRPRFDADAINRVRTKMQVILVEQSESPHYKLSRAWQENIYGTHPYARPGLGTKESLDALKVEDFRDYLRRYITRENIIISVVGDITPEEITALVDARFSELPASYAPDREVADIAFPDKPDTVIVKHTMPQTMVSFGLGGLKRDDPDYIAATIVNYMVGGSGLNSRLAREIRVKRGLAYSVRSQLDTRMHAGTWRGMFSTRNDQAKNALAAVHEVLVEYMKTGVSERELADAKAFLTGSFVLNLSSNVEVANFLTMMQIHKLGSDYMERRNDMFNAVTLADITRVSQRLIDPAKLRVVIVGQPEL